MAKIPFTKLGLKLQNEIKTIEFNQQFIEIKQYLSIQDKLQIITNVMNYSMDSVNGFINPIKVKVYMIVEIIQYYTNINFTEKQKENIVKLYDLIIESGLMDQIFNEIPNEEIEEIKKGVNDSVQAYDRYRHSAMGVVELLSTQYNELDFDVESIKDKLTNPEILSTVKELAAFSGYSNTNIE